MGRTTEIKPIEYEDLKPCPFCGENGAQLIELSSISWHGCHHYYVECAECGASTTEFGSIDNAAELWNMRYGE